MPFRESPPTHIIKIGFLHKAFRFSFAVDHTLRGYEFLFPLICYEHPFSRFLRDDLQGGDISASSRSNSVYTFRDLLSITNLL
jgi:hypothetical protein